jgi:hypothetical protein
MSGGLGREMICPMFGIETQYESDTKGEEFAASYANASG